MTFQGLYQTPLAGQAKLKDMALSGARAAGLDAAATNLTAPGVGLKASIDGRKDMTDLRLGQDDELFKSGKIGQLRSGNSYEMGLKAASESGRASSTNDANAWRKNRLPNQIDIAGGPNTSTGLNGLGDGLTPYQQASLALRAQKMAGVQDRFNTRLDLRDQASLAGINRTWDQRERQALNAANREASGQIGKYNSSLQKGYDQQHALDFALTGDAAELGPKPVDPLRALAAWKRTPGNEKPNMLSFKIKRELGEYGKPADPATEKQMLADFNQAQSDWDKCYNSQWDQLNSGGRGSGAGTSTTSPLALAAARTSTHPMIPSGLASQQGQTMELPPLKLDTLPSSLRVAAGQADPMDDVRPQIPQLSPMDYTPKSGVDGIAPVIQRIEKPVSPNMDSNSLQDQLANVSAMTANDAGFGLNTPNFGRTMSYYQERPKTTIKNGALSVDPMVPRWNAYTNGSGETQDPNPIDTSPLGKYAGDVTANRDQLLSELSMVNPSIRDASMRTNFGTPTFSNVEDLAAGSPILGRMATNYANPSSMINEALISKVSPQKPRELADVFGAKEDPATTSVPATLGQISDNMLMKSALPPDNTLTLAQRSAPIGADEELNGLRRFVNLKPEGDYWNPLGKVASQRPGDNMAEEKLKAFGRANGFPDSALSDPKALAFLKEKMAQQSLGQAAPSITAPNAIPQKEKARRALQDFGITQGEGKRLNDEDIKAISIAKRFINSDDPRGRQLALQVLQYHGLDTPSTNPLYAYDHGNDVNIPWSKWTSLDDEVNRKISKDFHSQPLNLKDLAYETAGDLKYLWDNGPLVR